MATGAVRRVRLPMPPALLLVLLLLVLPPPAVSVRLAPLLRRGPGKPPGAGAFPPTCGRIECPGFDVVETGEGFEVRRYNSTAWTSTAPIDDISLVDATRAGFLRIVPILRVQGRQTLAICRCVLSLSIQRRLFDYIQGKNEYGEKIDMTAPVITQVSPSDGPFCASSFVVSFYVPKANQADPPPADGLHLQRWGAKYAAVRQFGGFVSDANVGQEAAALYASLADSRWSSAVEKGQSADPASYTVAQYNSPFEFSGRVNEIWMFLDIDVSPSSSSSSPV